MKKKEKVLFFSLFILFLIIVVFGFYSYIKIVPPHIAGYKVENGFINFTGFDFSRYGMILLEGNWKYSNKEMKNGDEYPDTITVPSHWNKKLSTGEGYAFLYLEILVDIKPDLYVYIKDAKTAYEIYINGEKVAYNGKFGKSKNESIPQRLPVFFQLPEMNRIRFVWKLCNFYEFKGGPVNTPVIGTRDALSTKLLFQDLIDILSIGILILITIYHFQLWILRSKDKEYLLFSIFSFLMFLRLFVLSCFFERLFPSLNNALFIFEIHYKAKAISITLGWIFFIYFFSKLFQDYFNKKIIYIYCLIGIFYSILILLTNARIFTSVAYQMEWLLILGCLLVIYAIIRAYLSKIEGASILLFGFTIFFGTIINDQLYNNGIIITGDLAHFGITFYMLAQSSFLAFRFSHAMDRVENLSVNLQNEVNNMTEEMRLQKTQLEIANKELRKMDDYKTELFQNISHELKTPLTLILGPLEKLRGNKQYSMKDNKYIEIIHRNARQLNTLINQILELTKIDLGKTIVEMECIDIIKYVTYIKESFELQAKEKNVQLSFSTNEKKIMVKLDKEKFHIIISNILSNAFKFVNINGEVVISIKRIKSDNYPEPGIQIDILNTGSSIPESEQEIIFNRLYQSTSSTFHKTGLGLGLALVKEYILLHNGEIHIESTQGQWTKFIIILPMEVDITERNDKNIIEKESLGIESSKPAILLVEDNDDLRFYLKDNLKLYFQVIEAIDGNDAFQKAVENKPSVIISDILMPNKNGFELLKDLQENEHTQDIPFLFITAKSSYEEKIKGLQMGAIDYINKPFQIELLYLKLLSITKNTKFQSSRIKNELENKISRVLRENRQIDKLTAYYTYNIKLNEKEVIDLLLKGNEYKEIAQMLHISENTVKKRISRVYSKCGVQNKIELMRLLMDLS
ncbi:MAG: response regulator [Spirochaetales bacterium]|nr:response regulator [Spirochaetales bacterium]